MRLLALDQSSRCSGWSVFINNELKDWGHLETTQNELGERLVDIRKFIIKKVQEWEIDTIAFEDIQLQSSVGNNVKTFKILANVYGVVLETAVELNKKILIIPSVTWKSQLIIKGKNRPEQKKNAQLFVVNTYNVKSTQDESDAICIGTCACRLTRTEKAPAAISKEDGLDWSN